MSLLALSLYRIDGISRRVQTARGSYDINLGAM